MIKTFKYITFVIGLMASVLGLFSLIDAITYSDFTIAPIVSIFGFMGVGAILLITSRTLTFDN